MSTPLLYALISVIGVSLVSLMGVFTLSLSKDRLYRMIFVLVALSVGALFGDVFLHLLPEAFEKASRPEVVAIGVLLGLLTFFALEKFLRWGHHHPVDEEVEEGEGHVHPVGYLNLTADAMHNFIDGIIIGVSFLVDPRVGVATTVAVLLHELPQEIGDFAILIHAGFSKQKALFLNFLSALVSVLGVLLAFALGGVVDSIIPFVISLAAGGFIYIAGSDLVPELHKTTGAKNSFIQFLAIIVGVGLMVALTFIE